MAAKTRRRTFRVRSADDGIRRESPVLNQAASNYVALVNITREQVQAKGKGFEFIMNPGCIDRPGTKHRQFHDARNCVLIMRSNVALKMAARKKAMLRLLPLREGKLLLAKAQGYAKDHGSEAFYRALADIRPQWVLRNDVDEAREARQRKQLIARYKQIVGEPPDESWSNSRIEAATRSYASGFQDGVGIVNDDIFEMFGAPIDGVTDGVPVERESPLLQEDEDEGDDPFNPGDVISAPARPVVKDAEAERRRALVEQLTSLGVKTWPAQKVATLEKLLAAKLAEQAPVAAGG